MVADQVGEMPCVFLTGLHRAERTIAERLTRLANGTLPWPWILAESQVAAIRLALMSKVLVMTGGPGVGKTTIDAAPPSARAPSTPPSAQRSCVRPANRRIPVYIIRYECAIFHQMRPTVVWARTEPARPTFVIEHLTEVCIVEGRVMSTAHAWRVKRRDFLQAAATGALALGLGVWPAAAEDAAETHNMLVFGEQTIFLSHLPMFEDHSKAGTEFGSLHRYQVILEAALTNEQRNLYMKDRKANPNIRLYTLEPDKFVLSRLFTPEAAPQLSSFTATVYRGHLEQGGRPVRELENVRIKIGRVVHARKFDPRGDKPTALEYLLVGKGKELFLAHAIFSPPDFDQVLPVSLMGTELTERDLSQDIRIVIPDRKNVAAARLRSGQRVQATIRIGSQSHANVQIEAGPQIYFEEGELLMPPTFKPTPEEKKKD